MLSGFLKVFENLTKQCGVKWVWMLAIVVEISLASSAIYENSSVDNCCDCLQETSYTCVASRSAICVIF